MTYEEFKGCNRTYGKDQSQYISLPAYEDDKHGGRTFHCWKLSAWERIKILATGRLWVVVLNFHKPLQPIKLMLENPFKIQ